MNILFFISHQPNPRFIKQINFLAENNTVTLLFFKRKTLADLNQSIANNVVIHDLGEVPNASQPVKRIGVYLKTIITLKKLIKLTPFEVLLINNIDVLLLYNAATIFKKKKAKVAIEISDLREFVFSESASAKRMRSLEKKLYKKYIDKLIVTSKKYYEYHFSNFFSKEVFVLENKLLSQEIQQNTIKERVENKKTTIGIIGLLLRKDEYIKLFETYKNSDSVDIHIHGKGHYQDLVKDYASKYNNISYFGPYNAFNDAERIYKSLDLIYLVYDTNQVSLNNKLALPNKLYECMYYHVPLICSKDTYLQEIVEESKIGTAISYKADGEIEAGVNYIMFNRDTISRSFKNLDKESYLGDDDYKNLEVFLAKEMVALLNKYKNKFKDLDIVFLLLIGTLSTFPLEKWNPKFIFLLFIFQFLIVIKKRSFKIKTTPFFWMLIGMYALNFIGLLYTQDFNKGFTVITRQVSFVLFPLFYASYNLRNVKLLLKIYCIALFVFLIIFEIYTVYRFLYKSDIFPLDLELFLSFRYTGAELTKLIEMHNAYLGMYIIMSNILIVSFLRTTKRNLYFLLLLFVIVFQSLFLMQMVSKTAIILNILIIIPSLIYLLLKLKKIKTLLFLTIVVIGIGYFTITKFNLPLNRIIERVEELSNSKESDRETRSVIWESAIPLIKENIIFGVGTGDANKVLVEKFKQDGLKTTSNVHNQYLDYLLRFGAMGLIIFLFVFGYAIYLAVKLDNYIYFCFLILILGSCLTENILSRQWGITFFACFNFMFYLIATKTYKWQ